MRKYLFFRASAAVMIAVLLAAVGCKKEQRLEATTEPASKPAPGAEMLPAGADSLEPATVIGDQEVRLEAYLWRDFMPGSSSEPEGHPLRGVVRIFSVDGQPIESTLDIEYVWVDHDDSIWGNAMPDPTPMEPSSAIQENFAGGPEWATGSKVDVVVRLVDQNGLTSYLRVNDIAIVTTQ